MTGTLYGVGLGPGDPELVTVKAARLITAADVVAYHSARHGRSIARAIAEPYLREGQLEEALVYPVTTEDTDHPGGYDGALDEFYQQIAARLAGHLDAGRDVALLCAGDPLFYGSYMHMHTRLGARYPTEVVPGVTSVSAASAVLRRPLVQHDEVLTVLPGTLPAPELAARLAGTDAAAVLKLGRTFDTVRKAFAEAGRLDDAWYVERATTGRQRLRPLAEVDPDSVPYFSLALLPSPAPRASQSTSDTGEVMVVGLGPGDDRWLTPQAAAALARAEHLVGYESYLDRVPERPGQQRHGSGNRVEAERAALALDLALGGATVAVVSSGDPGVFAMASAVLERAAEPRWAGVKVRVLPGVTAAHAAAARVGAPLGHDYCVLSLSDRLKPWEIIERRLDAAGAADLVVAIYNPASRSRVTQLDKARDILLRHRDPGTPVVIARDVGGTAESITVATLAGFDSSTVDMRCLVIVGSSRTRVTDRAGSAQVWTPRHYEAGSGPTGEPA